MNKLIDALRSVASLCEKEASDLGSSATNAVALFDLRRALDEVEKLASASEEHFASSGLGSPIPDRWKLMRFSAERGALTRQDLINAYDELYRLDQDVARLEAEKQAAR